MATLSDKLITVLELQGIAAFTGGFERAAVSALGLAAAETKASEATLALTAAKTAFLAPLAAMVEQSKGLAAVVLNNIAGFGQMAAAEGLATAATVTLESVLLLLQSPLVLIVGALAALTAGIAIAGKSLSAFSESEDAIGRLAIRLRDSGNAFPIAALQQFAGGLQSLTGISDEVITTLGATAAQFGLNRAQIEKLVPTVLDISVALKRAPEEVERALLRASRGRPQGLVALGIDPSKIKGDLHDVNNLISQIGAGFAGTAEAFRHTLPGTVSALQNSVSELFEALGRFISPVVVPLLNLLISAIDRFTAALSAIADAFPGLFPTAARLGEGKANPLALKGDPEQTAALHGIENNTGKMQSAISRVIGGAGTEAKRAWTIRDARMAVGI